MAKLYFYYSAMNAGKTTSLLQSSYNYNERGMNTLCFLPKCMSVSERGQKIHSRIGIDGGATCFDESFSFCDFVNGDVTRDKISCLLIDEAQFLTKLQVYELTDIVDFMNIPILTYGLRTDFLQNLFEGSKYLLAWADELIEIKTICFCGKKATMTARVSSDGRVFNSGEQLAFGGNESYISFCRKHYKMSLERGVALVCEDQ
ncbi:thymidine kinase [Candidatus Hydrogenosomobacter endosymbioticus]